MTRNFTAKYLYMDYRDGGLIRIWVSNRLPNSWYSKAIKDAEIKFDGTLLEIRGSYLKYYHIYLDEKVSEKFLSSLIVKDEDYRKHRFGKKVTLKKGCYLYKEDQNVPFDYSTTMRFEIFDVRGQ